MKALLKQRYSVVDVVLALAIMSVIFGFWILRQKPLSYASEFDPEQAEAAALPSPQDAFADIVARRDAKIPPEKQKEIARLFHDLGIWQQMWYLGIRIHKNPCDLWMMQQIIYETRPDIIIETGTFRGGSTLYFAHVLEEMGLEGSKVITVDIENACQEAAEFPVWQKRVEFILGSSTDPAVVARIAREAKGKRVFVTLDSVHSRDHVLEELRCYAPLVSPGGYIVVEDTNCDGIPIFPNYLGPTAAVREFLQSDLGKDFSQERQP